MTGQLTGVKPGVVLVVGGAGYLGSLIVRDLLARRYSVRVVDRLYYGDRGLAGLPIELFVADMRQMSEGVWEGVQGVINVAGISNDPCAEFNPAANYALNTAAAAELAREAIAHNVTRYILASSCSIYDRTPHSDELLDESAQVSPKASYAISKLAAEMEVLGLKSPFFWPVALRMGTLYGFSPRMRYDLVVNSFVRSALKDGVLRLEDGGRVWRPLTDVQDAASAYGSLLTRQPADIMGKVVNLVGANYRISELALEVRDILRKLGVHAEIESVTGPSRRRSYRATLGGLPDLLQRPALATAVASMVEQIRQGYDDFDNPEYFNLPQLEKLQAERPDRSIFEPDAIAVPA